MRRQTLATLLIFAAIAALGNVVADVGQVPKQGGSGGSTSLVSGSTPVTGCQNLIPYGNNSNILECEAALSYVTASNTMDVDTLDVNVAATVTLGTGTGNGSVGGVICKGAPALATTGTAEEQLASCVIPANTLSADGSAIRIYAVGHTAANANNKRFRVVYDFAGTPVAVGSSGTVPYNNKVVWLDVTIWRLSATTVVFYNRNRDTTDGGVIAAVNGLDFGDNSIAITHASAQTLSFTGTTATSAGDFTLDAYMVEVLQ
jgi:hypothetical protein